MSELKHLIKIHQDILNYIASIDDFFCMQIFYDFAMVGPQVVLSLYVVTLEFWANGYSMIFAVVTPLLIQCLYGVVVEIKCEKLMNQIYEIQWHLLKVSERKIFLIFLTKAQFTELLTVAHYLPLNLETFTNVSWLHF